MFELVYMSYEDLFICEITIDYRTFSTLLGERLVERHLDESLEKARKDILVQGCRTWGKRACPIAHRLEVFVRLKSFLAAKNLITELNGRFFGHYTNAESPLKKVGCLKFTMSALDLACAGLLSERGISQKELEQREESERKVSERFGGLKFVRPDQLGLGVPSVEEIDRKIRVLIGYEDGSMEEISPPVDRVEAEARARRLYETGRKWGK